MKPSAPSHGTVVAYLALFMAMTGTAAAATGGTFVLGRGNSATTPTSLANSGSGPVLALSARTGQPPLSVGAAAGKATNLNSDKLDGLDSSSFLRRGGAVDATSLGGQPASAFARVSSLDGFQRRVAGSCSPGQAVRAVNTDGTVSCVPTGPEPVTTSPPTSRDKGFAISDLQLRRDVSDDWSGVARITNENQVTKSALFTVTVFRDGRIVATLRGSVSELAAGMTNTVQFVTSDDFTEGSYTTTFQTDNAF